MLPLVWSSATTRPRRHLQPVADDKRLIELVRKFKAVGVPVSLLRARFDLLDAPSATPAGSAASR